MAKEIGKCLICESLKELVDFDVGGSVYSICKPCKKKIINGLRSQDELLDAIVCEDLLALRSLFLQTLGYSLDWISNRIKYERMLGSNGYKGGLISNKKRCLVCGEDKNIKVIVPNFVSMFVGDDTKRFGIPLCAKCKKSVTKVTDSL